MAVGHAGALVTLVVTGGCHGGVLSMGCGWVTSFFYRRSRERRNTMMCDDRDFCLCGDLSARNCSAKLLSNCLLVTVCTK